MTATRNPRILSVQPVSDGGGSEHALIGMIRELTAAGWECHVALPGPVRLASEYAAAGAHLHVVPMRHLTTSGRQRRWLAYAAGWPIAVGRLVTLARRIQPDVIHSNSLHTWYPCPLSPIMRRPLVWHAREIVFQSRAALTVERFLTRHFADRVIAVSKAVADQLDAPHIEVVLDGADPGRFGPERAGRFRRAAGIGDAVPLVGFVGRFDTWKGLDTLLDAIPLIQARRPDAELVVAGSAVAGKEELADQLEARATATAGVHWLGWRDDVPDLMADLDLFVAVSTQPEPFGLVVVEALASGVPVVAGAAGGPLEVLGAAPATAGRLVAPGDPGAIAEAAVALLPAQTSAQLRGARAPIGAGDKGRLVQVFTEVLQRKRSSW